MNKTITLLTLCACATSSALAVDIVGAMGSGTRTPLTPANKANANLVAPSGTATGSTLYYIGKNTTVSSITTQEGYKYNVASGIILDTATAGLAVGIQDNSNELLFGNPLENQANGSGDFIIKNSAGNYETVINSSKFILSQTNPTWTKPVKFDVRTDATIYANDVQILSDQSATQNPTQVNVGSGITLKINADTFTFGKNVSLAAIYNASLRLNAVSTINGTMNFNGKLYVEKATTVSNGGEIIFRTAAGAVPNLTVADGQTITFANDGSLKLGGTSTASNDNVRTFNLSSDKVVFNNGNLYIQGGWTLNYKATSADDKSKVISMKTLSLGGESAASAMTTGTLVVDKFKKIQAEYVTLNEGSSIQGYGGLEIKYSGTLTLNEGSSITLTDVVAGASDRGRLLLNSLSVVNVEGNNTLTRIDASTGEAANLNVVVLGATTFNVNADVSFGAFACTANSTMEINLFNSDAVFYVDHLEGDLRDGFKFIVNGYQDNRIYIGGENINKYFDRFELYDVNGFEVQGSLVSNNGWLAISTVPEPAEWAMILGSLSLVISIYR